MALIIEDGSIVAGANSYITVVEARTYADARGITLPADDAEVEVLLVSSMDYLEAQRNKYQGSKIESGQSLQWPRYPVYIDGFLIGSNTIPNELKNAQSQLSMEVFAGVDVLPTTSGSFVTKEKVGPIETEYSESVGTGSAPNMSAVNSLLKPLYKPSAACGGIPVLRV